MNERDRRRVDEDWLQDDTSLEPPGEKEGARPGETRRRWNLPPLVLGGVLAVVILIVVALLVVGIFRGGGSESRERAREPAPRTETAKTATRPEAAALPERGRLEPGDRGRRVRALQRALTELGYDPGRPDGIFGPQTRQALRRFQRDAGLETDGIAGPRTLRALNRALVERS